MTSSTIPVNPMVPAQSLGAYSPRDFAPCRCMGLNCGECRKTIPYPLDMAAQGRLRAMRLFHWRSVLAHRMYARGKGLTPRFIKDENAVADMHLGFVQTLNDFFAVGDTAERDAERQDVRA